MGSGRPDPRFEIPDLELPVAPARRVSASPARLAPPPAQEPVSGAIEVEPWQDDAHSGARAAGVDDLFGKNLFEADPDEDLALGVAGLELAAPRREEPAAGSDWPSGRSPERTAHHFETAVVSACARFPPAPPSSLLAPRYAWQVLVRRRDLRVTLARLDRELGAAERQRDELLGRMVSEVRPQLEADPRLLELLGAARELGALTGERGQALEAINAQYRTALAGAEAQRGELEGKLAQHQGEQRARAAALAASDENWRRAEGQKKRSLIELRAALEVAQKKAQAAGLPPGTAHPEDAARVEELQKRAQSHEPEVAKLAGERAAAQAAHDTAASAVGALERELARLGAAQRAIDRDFGKRVDVNAAGLTAAEDQLRSALAEAGRAVLALRGGVSIDRDTLAGIAGADAEVARLGVDCELHQRALDACDHAAVQRGHTLLALAAGALLLLLIAFAVSAC
jgi:hypothetical protein